MVFASNSIKYMIYKNIINVVNGCAVDSNGLDALEANFWSNVANSIIAYYEDNFNFNTEYYS